MSTLQKRGPSKRTQVSNVTEELLQRHISLDNLGTTAAVHALHHTTSSVQVTGYRTSVFVGAQVLLPT